jgi:hypothetical protein
MILLRAITSLNIIHTFLMEMEYVFWDVGTESEDMKGLTTIFQL